MSNKSFFQFKEIKNVDLRNFSYQFIFSFNELKILDYYFLNIVAADNANFRYVNNSLIYKDNYSVENKNICVLNFIPIKNKVYHFVLVVENRIPILYINNVRHNFSRTNIDESIQPTNNIFLNIPLLSNFHGCRFFNYPLSESQCDELFNDGKYLEYRLPEKDKLLHTSKFLHSYSASQNNNYIWITETSINGFVINTDQPVINSKRIVTGTVVPMQENGSKICTVKLQLSHKSVKINTGKVRIKYSVKSNIDGFKSGTLWSGVSLGTTQKPIYKNVETWFDNIVELKDNTIFFYIRYFGDVTSDFRLEISEIIIQDVESSLEYVRKPIANSTAYNYEIVDYQGETGVFKINPTNNSSYIKFDNSKFISGNPEAFCYILPKHLNAKVKVEFTYFVPNDSEFKDYAIEGYFVKNTVSTKRIDVTKGKWHTDVLIFSYEKNTNNALYIKGGYNVNSETNNANTIIYIKEIKSKILGMTDEFLSENIYQEKLFNSVDNNWYNISNNPSKILDIDLITNNPQAPDLILGNGIPNKIPDFIGQEYIDQTNNIKYISIGINSVRDWLNT